MLKKTFKIVAIVLSVLIGLFLLLYLVLALIGCALYGEARGVREYVCDIAGINEGIAPQGIAYSRDKNIYIQTGYASDNTTLLYLVENGKARRVHLLDEDGKTLKCHAGGVTCVQDCTYIANGGYLYRYSLNELYTASADTEVQVKQTIAVDNNASFCFNDGQYLYVGEFYREANYKTDESHHYVTPNGDENKAIISRYALNENGLIATEGVQPYPDRCISVTGLVQGFAVHDGVYMLSRSYGLRNSDLEYHTPPKESGKTISVRFKKNEQAESKDVPLTYLDSTTNFKTLTLPAFSEDLTIANGRVIVTNIS